MTGIDLPHLRQWLGREQHELDTIGLRQAELMAATLSTPATPYGPLTHGSELPPLWHWVYFLSAYPAHELGRDGHPVRGGFLPPVPLPNRMWAGGRLLFHRPITLGSTVQRSSQIAAIEHKQGRSGDLVFVQVVHRYHSSGNCCLEEWHDIVYTPARPARTSTLASAAARPKTPIPAHNALHHHQPDSTLLFRYSALTFNGHRIHYDADYCRQVEGYPNLVIHGPLLATWLADLAVRTQSPAGGRLRGFSYRALQPACLGQTITCLATPGANGLELQAQLDDTSPCMQAQAVF